MTSLEFSPDGDQLAVGTFGKFDVNVRLWKQNAKILKTISQFKAGPLLRDAVRYSPDSSAMSIVHLGVDLPQGSSHVALIDTRTWEKIGDLSEPALAPGAYVRSEFTTDGHFVVRATGCFPGSPGNSFAVYNRNDFSEVWSLKIQPPTIQALALSRDGRLAAVGGTFFGPGSSGRIQILVIDMHQKQVLRTIDEVFPANTDFGSLAWNPDGVHLAAGGAVGGTNVGPDAVRVFDALTGELVGKEPAKEARVSSMRYTRDGKLLIEDWVEGAVRIWDSGHKNLLFKIAVSDASPALAVSDDSRYLAVANRKSVEVYELKWHGHGEIAMATPLMKKSAFGVTAG